MQKILYVFVGGGLGCVFRYAMVLAVNKIPGINFPWGTAAVNITGSLLIGVILGFSVIKPSFSQAYTLLLVTGFLGGFTTFSAFSWETLALLKNQGILPMILNITLNIIGCMAAVFTGALIGKNLA